MEQIALVCSGRPGASSATSSASGSTPPARTSNMCDRENCSTLMAQENQLRTREKSMVLWESRIHGGLAAESGGQHVVWSVRRIIFTTDFWTSTPPKHATRPISAHPARPFDLTRPFYRSALESIRRYVERDLRRLDRPPSILCACKPRHPTRAETRGVGQVEMERTGEKTRISSDAEDWKSDITRSWDV